MAKVNKPTAREGCTGHPQDGGKHRGEEGDKGSGDRLLPSHSDLSPGQGHKMGTRGQSLGKNRGQEGSVGLREGRLEGEGPMGRPGLIR